jgi:hypothetical protein
MNKTGNAPLSGLQLVCRREPALTKEVTRMLTEHRQTQAFIVVGQSLVTDHWS